MRGGDVALIAARDGVLQAWWDAADFDALTAALETTPERRDLPPLAEGARRLWWARLARDEAEAVVRARGALAALRTAGAAWWMAHAIAILDDAGDATREERAERRAIHLRLLGMPPGLPAARATGLG
jgi:hypothetical protein